jgi:predicted RNA-binding Zn ribbon-like protein
MVSAAGRLPLVGGALALDFANTAAGRGTDGAVEHLRSADDLVAWAAHAGAIGAEAAARIRPAFARGGAGGRVLDEARALREAIFGVGSAVAQGRRAPPADLATLSRCAGAAVAAARLVPADDGYALAFTDPPPEMALLGPIAWSALDLVTHGEIARLKQCPGQGCGWLFLDHSKNGSRRWCDMATCGNRAKARTHRLRRG